MASPQQFITALEHLRIVTYFNVASAALLIYDYFLTFTREVTLIWPAQWNLMKVLFLLTRYLPFIDAWILVYNHLQRHPNVETCYQIFKAASWLFYVGTALPEIILTLRTWAVWNRDWRLTIGLPILFVCCWGPIIGFIIVFVKSLAFMPLTSPALLGCLVIKGSHIITLCWTLLLVYEFAIFLLMLIKGIQCYRNGGSSGLFRVVYRDGLIYYLYLFAFSLTNVIVVATVPPDLQVVLVLTERVLHPILGCRVILDIRNQVSNKTHTALIAPPPQKGGKIASQNTSLTRYTDTTLYTNHEAGIASV